MTWKDITNQKANVQLQILKQTFEIQDNQWREKVFWFVKKKKKKKKWFQNLVPWKTEISKCAMNKRRRKRVSTHADYSSHNLEKKTS